MKVNIITGPFGCLPPYAIGAVEKLWYSIGTDMRNKGHQVIFISKKPLKESSMDDNLLLHGYERTGSWVKDFVLDFVFSIKALSKMPKCDMLVLNSIWSPILCLLFKWKYRRALYNVARFPKKQMGAYFAMSSLACVSTAVYNALIEQSPSMKSRACVIPNPIDTHIFCNEHMVKTLSDSPEVVYSGRVHKEKGLDILVESEKENLLKLGYNDRIKIIANGIDVEDIEMKSSWKRNKEILFLSRVHVKKGINFLLEAVAQLKEQMEGYVIRIAGEGDDIYIDELKQLTVRLGISKLVIFEGGVYGNSKWELFRQADLFILPTHSENFGIVVAEALASGTPVVTTMGTPWSELESRRCGWWTEVGTEATVQALRNFLSLTENELEKMGRNGRKLVEEKYSAHKVAEEFVEMYKSIL